MERVGVGLGERSYEVVIGSGLLAKTGELIPSLRAAEKAFVASEAWDQAATAVDERAQLEGGATTKAALYATEAEYLGKAGDDASAVLRLEQATELDAVNEGYAGLLEARYREAERFADLAAYLLRRAEKLDDRVGMIATLASLLIHPESVPINMLVRVEGTPLAQTTAIEPLDFVRTIAVARITMPASMVRLSAGREDMSEETQALCFLAGANSIFYGPKLLTTPNPGRDRDMALLDKLGLRAMD